MCGNTLTAWAWVLMQCQNTIFVTSASQGTVNFSMLDRWLVNGPSFYSFCQVLLRITWCKSVSRAKILLPKFLQAFVWLGPSLWYPSYKCLVLFRTVFVLFLSSPFGSVVRFSFSGPWHSMKVFILPHYIIL